MTRWAVVVGVLLVLVAGCGADVTGRALADPAVLKQVSKTINAATVFGDGATVDPCSIVDVNDATAVQDVEFAPADALDDCALEVFLHDGTDTYVDVGPLESIADDLVPMSTLPLVQELPGDMELRMDNEPSDGFCQTYLAFEDGYDLMVGAYDLHRSDDSKEACASAEAMARDVAGQIEAGALRHLNYPAGSVALLDPCDLISDAALAAAHLPSAASTPYPESHQCFWETGDAVSPVTVRFPISDPSVDAESTDKRVTIAGRPSVIRQDDDSSTYCSVLTTLGTVPTGKQSQFNEGDVQLAEVDVTLPDSKADACAAATTLAAAAWPKLAHLH
jgi:hypothetical protein